MEFVPIALGCGHLIDRPALFEIHPDGSDISRAECPDGCGMQPFVVDPVDEG